MHAPKNAGLPPFKYGQVTIPRAKRQPRQQAETPGRISQNTDKNRLFHGRASLVFLRLVIVKYFTISSCPNGRRRYQYLKDQRVISHPTTDKPDLRDGDAGHIHILAAQGLKKPANKGCTAVTSVRFDEAAGPLVSNCPANAAPSRVVKDVAAESINSLKSSRPTSSARMTERISGSAKISASVISSIVCLISVSFR
ncbi:hypothetical protein AGROH133_14560 (plasmid) [Agrobacterium tumefaciens]|nr:hypothetical protein AGROH133_14560 [Agrobacterium tumefaciens]